MKIKIEEKQDNSLLNRQDITFLVDHTGEATPARNDVRAKLAALLNSKEDQLYIIKLSGLYGQSTSHGYAHLYPTKEAALKHEHSYVIKRHTTEEAASPPAPAEKVEEPKKAPKEEETPPKEEKPKSKEEKPKAEVKKDEPKAAPKEEKPKKAEPKEEKPEKAPKEK